MMFDYTETTVDRVAVILAEGQLVRKTSVKLEKKGFTSEEIKKLSAFDWEKLLETIFNAEFLYEWLNLYGGIELFGRITSRDIKKLIDIKAEEYFHQTNFEKGIFILKLLLQSVWVIEKLLNQDSLKPEQNEVIMRLVACASEKYYGEEESNPF